MKKAILIFIVLMALVTAVLVDAKTQSYTAKRIEDDLIIKKNNKEHARLPYYVFEETGAKLDEVTTSDDGKTFNFGKDWIWNSSTGELKYKEFTRMIIKQIEKTNSYQKTTCRDYSKLEKCTTEIIDAKGKVYSEFGGIEVDSVPTCGGPVTTNCRTDNNIIKASRGIHDYCLSGGTVYEQIGDMCVKRGNMVKGVRDVEILLPDGTKVKGSVDIGRNVIIDTSDLDKKIKEAEETINSKKDEISKLNNQLALANQAVEEAQRKYDAAYNELAKKSGYDERKIESLKKEIESLKKEIESLKKKLDDAKKEKQKIDKEIKDLENKIKKAKEAKKKAEEARAAILKKELIESIVSGIQEGAGAARTVTAFWNLGQKFGWWQSDPTFFGLKNVDKWFEMNIERFFSGATACRSWSDMGEPEKGKGYLPTQAGESAADIQAVRYETRFFNHTKQKWQTFYRFKLTFNVDATALWAPRKDKDDIKFKILMGDKMVDTDGVPPAKEKVLKDGNETRYGTSTAGRPLIIESDNAHNNTAVCIEFTSGITPENIEPYAYKYLHENGNKVCNSIKDESIPELKISEQPRGAVPPGATPPTPGGNEGISNTPVQI